ncbi:hypothetical protein CEH05_18385 [Halobacillus halophilus]|uniref:DUF2834 domain-containing protein n=1 Tax=Halobacillus halophilus (strain ATCC 35676 / DSM 2266 / JCM 20832 / KCTC 3685 / LMG 17431 / NBRC 102448 / NCIMB 2269) TaxID=866895 RepID=I0JSG0_HALH3|nr:hypothetical protein [Halobacillus halophilus]ASF41020.1 hypothetical protein CEH05_18385 [Halobacillus halophilus]CCG47082.1 conserved hypothetical protein [Halobacillus halophilus DSM 2266]
MKTRQIVFFLVWAGFILYAWMAAPNGNDGYLNQLIRMNDPDPLLLAVFSLLGLFPVTFMILLLTHDNSRIPAWPFAAGSFILGAFALLPFFFLSTAEKKRSDRTPRILKRVLNAVYFHVLLMVGTTMLIIYGLLQGDFTVYAQAFKNSQFVHVMTIDLFVLTGLSIYTLHWDQQKTGVQNKSFLWGVLPVIGVMVYLLQNKDQRRQKIEG